MAAPMPFGCARRRFSMAGTLTVESTGTRRGSAWDHSRNEPASCLRTSYRRNFLAPDEIENTT
jgi:hypothetical protein